MIIMLSMFYGPQIRGQYPLLNHSSNPNASPPLGSNFDHIVIVAMENQNYASVMGSGTGSSSAPFLTSMLAEGSTIPNYHSYGSTASVNGCSAGCYIAVTSGSDQGKADGWCPRASSPCLSVPNIASEMVSSGLTWAAFCEDGCSRGADHFPWIGYTNTWDSCVTSFSTCSGPNIYNSLSTTTPIDSQLINYLNSSNPANLVWFTPTDNHNMHDNSVSSGDTYLKQLLVGTGTLASPAQGSMLSTGLFKNPVSRTLLYLWWDEYDPSPNLVFGSMINSAFISVSTNYDEYSSLHMIENNWALPALGHAAQAPNMSDIFGTPSQPLPSFAITSPVKAVSVMQTFSQNITVTLQSLNGFTGMISLTSSVNCTTIMTHFANPKVALTGGVKANATLTIHTTNSTIGDYAITVVGTTANISQSLTMPLDVSVLGDLDGDGTVSIIDVSIVLIHYNTAATGPGWYPLADLNHDGIVNIEDLAIVMANYDRTAV